ncbi:MAG TPA: hypothetical protein VH186_12050 [Chloroflexia bacterium]|nr:hypothetical protein [Chloroflexia bacterium]
MAQAKKANELFKDDMNPKTPLPRVKIKWIFTIYPHFTRIYQDCYLPVLPTYIETSIGGFKQQELKRTIYVRDQI